MPLERRMLSTSTGRLLINRTIQKKDVMKCELCKSDEREPKLRLCLPCLEAVARLWSMSSHSPDIRVRDVVRAKTADRARGVPIVAVSNLTLM